MSDNFWHAVNAQLAELRKAKNADDVLRILSPDRNPYRLEDPCWNSMDGAAQGFFAGSGGNDTMDDALDDAGWRYVWTQAIYWWAMRAPDGSEITYCEGDVYRGNKRPGSG